jgi:hypothetical protein
MTALSQLATDKHSHGQFGVRRDCHDLLTGLTFAVVAKQKQD